MTRFLQILLTLGLVALILGVLTAIFGTHFFLTYLDKLVPKQ